MMPSNHTDGNAHTGVAHIGNGQGTRHTQAGTQPTQSKQDPAREEPTQETSFEVGVDGCVATSHACGPTGCPIAPDGQMSQTGQSGQQRGQAWGKCNETT